MVFFNICVLEYLHVAVAVYRTPQWPTIVLVVQ
jgi:hypothetical protein